MNSLRLPAAGLLVVLLTPLPMLAVTDSWDGGGADNNLTTNLNWFDNTAPESNFITTDLIFAGTTRTWVNFNTSFAANSVTFDATAGAFTLSAGGGQTLLIKATGITIRYRPPCPSPSHCY